MFCNLFEQLDNLKPYKLSYEDIELLNENWISNENLISNFPSFYFWLCKNYDFFIQIHKELIYKKEDNSISFWIICIRIITLINCITNENIGKPFKQDLISFIKEEINKRKKLNSNWINLMMDDVNDKIEIQIFSFLYNFIIKISKDNKHINNKLNEIKNTIIKQVFKNIYTSIFDNSLMNIFEKDINYDEQIINFIVEPNQYIYQQIELFINIIKENIISNNSFIEFKTFLENNINEIKSFINFYKFRN